MTARLDEKRRFPYLPAMALRSIITAPDPRLKLVSDPLQQVDDSTRRLMDDMLETMYDAPGIGLAAIQIGVPQRVIVMDLAKEKEGEPKTPMFFVNPKLLWASNELVTCEEGCLSVPDLYEDVERPSRVKVSFLDYFGKEQQVDADGMLAVCLQHEMDHLQGTLFIDHLSRLKREIMLKKLIKARKSAEREVAD
jgi:peptide deformylase